MTHEEVVKTTSWAVKVADEYNIAITTVIKMFQLFREVGMNINEAKNEVEKRYVS